MTAGALGSQTVTESGSSDPFDTSGLNALNVTLTVTDATGTDPTINVTLWTAAAGEDFYSLTSFPQCYGEAVSSRVIGPVGVQSLWVWELGGTDPAFTFEITAGPAAPTTGEPYTTPDALRAVWPILENPATHPAPVLAGLVAEFEQIVEVTAGRGPFRRRSFNYSTRANQYGWTSIPQHVDVEITAVSVNGTEYTSGQLDALHPVGSDAVLSGASWCPGDRLVIEGVHGFTEPTAGILRACGEFVRSKRLAAVSNKPRSTSSYQDPDSGYIYREIRPDFSKQQWTGLDEVDNPINQEPRQTIPGIG